MKSIEDKKMRMKKVKEIKNDIVSERFTKTPENLKKSTDSIKEPLI